MAIIDTDPQISKHPTLILFYMPRMRFCGTGNDFIIDFDCGLIRNTPTGMRFNIQSSADGTN